MLGQACAHCRKFLAAASRRSLGRVSVPVWLSVLTDQLPVTGLVGRYPANNLMGRGLLRPRLAAFRTCVSVCGISPPFGGLSPTVGQIPTCSSAVRHSLPEGSAFDLHALGTPPAFVLSQDQTLHCMMERAVKPTPAHSPQRRRTCASSRFSCEGARPSGRGANKKPGERRGKAARTWRRFRRGEPPARFAKGKSPSPSCYVYRSQAT